MEYVLETHETPDRWQVILVGHIDDLADALEALEENLEEAWMGFVQTGDDDEAEVVITLKWLDQGMTQMVRSIIETDHNQVTIVSNGKVQKDDYRDNGPEA